MAGKSKKSENKLVDKKKIKAVKAGKKDFRKMIPALPKNIQEKMNSEKNPEAVMAKALENYYNGSGRRQENALQKEIDNNIIEIQRRHISDLKDQLETSNKNYGELMKTYQAYMLQVQPMVEAAQLQKASELKLSNESEKQTEMKTENEIKQEEKAGDEIKQKEKTETEKEIESKSKKWYKFWK
ncbi:hypothetical protein [Methanimicrococcus blatticola]|uniref:Uncharacterized protein n=1 Tax=Methanimicrococcus blatticola TaxID=91560 RepID=A0A484F3R7_9EURY|nr:hypothetical protein [Methanimicrococcus blatticola]MBZ3935299.1 hypothetical protein [Methanimicrococcus blatticola]MCC2508603.1 hypothetical protein [Methanimicrococcus blatticola]TDQ67909.1 hypothetical protein C7391_1463 [Methanimicrococcus blatticola]